MPQILKFKTPIKSHDQFICIADRKFPDDAAPAFPESIFSNNHEQHSTTSQPLLHIAESLTNKVHSSPLSPNRMSSLSLSADPSARNTTATTTTTTATEKTPFFSALLPLNMATIISIGVGVAAAAFLVCFFIPPTSRSFGFEWKDGMRWMVGRGIRHNMILTSTPGPSRTPRHPQISRRWRRRCVGKGVLQGRI